MRRGSITLIARHYPPAVSGGARRPLLFAQALRELGVSVQVVAPSLPPGESGCAMPHPARDPAVSAPSAAGWRDLARDLFLWPDPDIRWSMRAARAALALPRTDWVMTTSPPESIHAAGQWLKRRTGARWIADFRDHWLVNPHRRQRRQTLRRAFEAHIARTWLKQADLVTAVDATIAAELKQLGARAPHVIPHVAAEAQDDLPLPRETINVVHTGSLALSDPACDVALLLAPFEAALARNPKLRLHLAGRLTATEQAKIAASPARDAVINHGVLPLAQAQALQRSADALIFAAAPKMHVPPSKITEYLLTDAPIIACGEGPWRADPRSPKGNPESALGTLTKGARNTEERLRPPSPAMAAHQLLDLMQRA